ncbi:MAG: hypothetical protein KIT09_14385 [Bryobacteraceae bacterium]|nr:hypothetical protein [Bryobacteraceae bacterium]
MGPTTSKRDFQSLEVNRIWCPRCRQAMPVRKHLLLVLLDKELYDYLCVGCGTSLGKKEEPPQPMPPMGAARPRRLF